MRRSRGFTLLEVMIATAIMSIGIVGALELISGSMKLAGDADKQSRATVLARELVDEELWRDVLETGQRDGRQGDFFFTVATSPVDRQLRSETENDDDFRDAAGELGLWLIQAEVRWESPGGAKAVRLETARIGEVPR